SGQNGRVRKHGAQPAIHVPRMSKCEGGECRNTKNIGPGVTEFLHFSGDCRGKMGGIDAERSQQAGKQEGAEFVRPAESGNTEYTYFSNRRSFLGAWPGVFRDFVARDLKTDFPETRK